MLERIAYCTEIENAFDIFPIIAILGPRQCGKTTLSRYIASRQKTNAITHFDLESPVHLSQLEHPELVLSSLKGLVIIDEIQRKPNLFPILRVLVDRPNSDVQFLILGSASRELIRQSSESLAGRIRYIELTPFSLNEYSNTNQLWVRGGFPKSVLATSDSTSFQWRTEYVRTFLEQDIPNLGFSIPAQHIRRAWMMMAHYHGQTINYSELSRSLDISDTTLKRYLDILQSTFMIRTLQPWHANIAKRQLKTPKLYFRDSGIFHNLLGIQSHNNLLLHPKLGASWEGFALEMVIRVLKADSKDCYFWGIHQQTKLDLLIFDGSNFKGFEFKFSDNPTLTPSMATAISTLGLKQLTVITPHHQSWALSENINVIGLEEFIKMQTSFY